MSKKTDALLEQLLVEIRGLSSSRRTPDLQSGDVGASPSASTKPKKNKGGRPKGSKNKPKVSLNSKTSGLKPEKKGAVPLPSTIIEEKEVDIFVSPVININGTDYAGTCRVKESIANTLRYMMEQHKKSLEWIHRDENHILTKPIGDVRNV